MKTKSKFQKVVSTLGIAAAALFISQPASAASFFESGGGEAGSFFGTGFSTGFSPVATGDFIGGDLDTNDVDVFTFYHAGGMLAMTTYSLIASPYGAQDTMLALLDSNNTLLAFNDDCGAPACGPNVGGPYAGFSFSSRITMESLAAGTYGVAISSYANFPSPFAIGSVVTGWNNGDITDGGLYHIDFTTAVPEPEIYAMMAAGLGLMGFVARRRQRNGAVA